MANQSKDSGEKLLASNPNAKANYQIQEIVEAGLVLTGTEAKSLRTQAPNLRDAFVDIRPRGKGFEAWLMNTHIGPYSHGNIWNHEATRSRKLLLHAHQIDKLYGAVIQKGMTIVPIRMYFKKGRAKIELGLGKGLKKYDKREEIKKKTVERELDQEMKRR
jgi:SsrA-binding protein